MAFSRDKPTPNRKTVLPCLPLFLRILGALKRDIGLQVQAQRIQHYLTDLRLKPHETRVIDLRNPRDAQKPDFQKNKNPAAAADGSVLWIRLDKVPVMGRLVVLKRRNGIASNYDCNICRCPPNYTTLSVAPTAYDMLPQDTEPFTSTSGSVDCNGSHWYHVVTTASGWASNYPTIAGVNNSTQKGQVTGVSGGAATITATYSDFTYTYSRILEDCIQRSRTLSQGGTCRVRAAKWAAVYSDTGAGPARSVVCSLLPARSGEIAITIPTTILGRYPLMFPGP